MKLLNFTGCLVAAFLFGFGTSATGSEDSVTIKVHFLHGSKPNRAYKYSEDRWFGGLLGGHTGIEIEPNRIFNFQPRSGLHMFAKPRIINSKFSIHDSITFYAIMSGKEDTVKKTVIVMRITQGQKYRLDSIVNVYRRRAPYDYAFFGMRCGAAAAEILGQLGITQKTGFTKTWMHTFYPRKLRRRLERAAEKNHYTVIKSQGNVRRRWEKD
ncbi:MAG: hypothetical protein IT236_06115 [Bacteroidia bacterium]|nr:hypothetical protein [Bacteroidia bacterium]